MNMKTLTGYSGLREKGCSGGLLARPILLVDSLLDPRDMKEWGDDFGC